MPTIVYLDVEDEITSAATRIRTSSETRVALVLPFGSRVATSRINFRLLAREAMINGRRLDVIAPDASARALAASAGLPVFASIGEYEAALEAPQGETGAATTPPGAGTPAVATGMPAVGSGTAAVASGTAAVATGTPARQTPGRAPVLADANVEELTGDESPGRRAGRRDGEPRVASAPRRRRIGTGAVVGFVVLVLALAVAGVAAFLLLPSADITVTPRISAIGPISLTVRADPDARAVDPDSGVIPAQAIDIPVEASGEFEATGKRVAETKASGGVRWTNCDPTAAYTIPRGTIVRTNGGTGFATDEAVFLPVASLSGTPPNVKIKCQASEVAITAVKAGTSGNVDAGAIRVIPARYNRTVISVTNPLATSGGTREEFAKVAQKDVDAAVEQLRKDLEAQFATALADPDSAPAGATVFPDTATLGDPVPDVDPATLVDKEVASFTLRMTAAGRVLAVDASPVEAIAEARLQGSITPGYQIVDGSIDVTVGDGSVIAGIVTFPVQGYAKEVRPIDATELRQQVLGLGEEDATSLLAPYGDVAITLWPDWVGTVPSLDQRVTFTIAPPVDTTPAPTPAPEPTAEPGGTPGEDPSADPSGDATASEPLPSP